MGRSGCAGRWKTPITLRRSRSSTPACSPAGYQGFLAWRGFAEKNPDLPVGFVLQGATTTDLPAAVVAAYDAPFPNAESKAGAAQFPLLVPTNEDTVGAKEMQAITDALSRWSKPALVAFSDMDPVFPYPQAGQAFCDLIPTAREQFKVEGAGHFLQEDRGSSLPGNCWLFSAKYRRNRDKGVGRHSSIALLSAMPSVSQARPSRLGPHSTPMLTSVDLINTVAGCPSLRPNSSAAFLVTDEVTTWSPPSRRILTTAITEPMSTSVIVPLSWFRVDSRTASLRIVDGLR